MNFLFKFLVLLKFIKIDENDINSWQESKNKELLLFSLQKAKFIERLLTIDAITSFNEKDIIPKLLLVAKNDYQEIAYKAIESIKILDKSIEYDTQLLEIEKHWAKKAFQKKNRVVCKKSDTQLDKRNRMKVLESVRQQLKRPMSGGKWF